MKVITVAPHATELNALLDQARHEELLSLLERRLLRWRA